MSLGAVLAVIAACAFVGAFPVWPWSRQFSHRPAIVWGLVLAIIVILIAVEGL